MSNLIQNDEYKDWLKNLKFKFQQTQIKAATRVNSTLLEFYWELGADIVEKQKKTEWGSGFLPRLSQDLIAEFPNIKGFSETNLKCIRKWYLFYNQTDKISQQLADQLPCYHPSEKAATCRSITKQQAELGQNRGFLLFQVPWWHNVVIISKCKNTEEALFYANKTVENGWSRSVLTHQIESKLYEREGKGITNFSKTLPNPQSDLAKELIKDPYNFDFLCLTDKYNEYELENALMEHLTKFLLELGAGFSFIGRQYELTVDEDSFFIDLLFYHVKLHCYVVVELKTEKFKPEFAGKLNFYVSAIDGELKSEEDKPTIGILICKSKNKTVVEYALTNVKSPIGISEYEITKVLPDKLKSCLPTIEQIEAELQMAKDKRKYNKR